MFTLSKEKKNDPYSVITTSDEIDRIKLHGLNNTKYLKITVIPISEEEYKKEGFKSLKGIAKRKLSLDLVREERLGR